MESNTPKGIKKVLLTVGIFLLVVVGIYFFVFHKTAPVTVLDQYGNPVQAQTVGSDLVALLAKLQTVSLNDAIFQNEAFIQLTDFGTALPVEPQGKADPFQSLSGGGVYKAAVKK